MTVQAIQTSSEVVLQVLGELDLTSIDSFKSTVDKLLDARDDRQFVFDLQQTDYIDSAGLEQLLVTSRKLAKNQARLIVRVKPRSQPQTVLAVAGFSAVMDIEPQVNI